MSGSKKEFYFQWHFLNKCNLRCKHCYQEGYQFQELPFDKLAFIADEICRALKMWKMKGRISITGGEPFVSSNFYSLLKYLDSKEEIVTINVLTNGTLITEKDVCKLKNIKKLSQIQISLDGASDVIHDDVRGSGAFAKALAGIRLLVSNNFSVALMFTLMKRNKKDYLKVIDLAQQEGVDAVTIERVTPCGNSSVEDVLSLEDIKHIYTDITVYANTLDSALVIRRARPLWINTAHCNTKENVNIGGFCPVGLTALAILWDGTILPCRRLEIPIGNVFNGGIFKAWYESDILWNIRDKNHLKGKCHGCKNIGYCGGCRAIAYALTGDYMEEDKQCWI